MSSSQQIREHLSFLYGSKISDATFERLSSILKTFRHNNPHLANHLKERRLTQADAILITYGDQIQSPDQPALQVLAEVLTKYMRDAISSVHLLPFYPYSSDDGFSIIDYTKVNPSLGDWQDLAPLRQNFRLMFDAVINHISIQSDWFQAFLQDNPQYTDYFIVEKPSTDLSSVTRPRIHPLLTPFKTPSGVKHVWTTFSADQVDLNYQNPDVLLEIIQVLLFYVAQGAEFIRLDAIGYLWKEIGTSCIHLPQTHQAIQLFRSALDIVAPNVILITETNVPHAENISYFGNGSNEAQMVYNFSLPPLILHTLHTGSAEVLQNWAASLETPGNRTAYFNFIASHDGIGVMPAKGLLTNSQIQALVDKTLTHGGLVNYKTNPDGSTSVYELNITLFDALSNPRGNEPEGARIDRFIVSQAIMLALAGVPGIYVHSLVGSSNNLSGLGETGRARTINRKKWLKSEFEGTLANPNSRASKILQRYKQILKARAEHAAFHPNGRQEIIFGNPAVFALLRTSPDGSEQVLCLHNVSAKKQRFSLEGLPSSTSARLQNILPQKKAVDDASRHPLLLAPYQIKWLLVHHA